MRIFKRVAGGLLGREAALTGGWPMALHGTGLPSALPVLPNGIVIHIGGVGTPSVLFARAAAPPVAR